RIRRDFFSRFFFLALELFLAFSLEFPLQLFDSCGQFLDLAKLGRVLCTQAVDLSPEDIGLVLLGVGYMYDRAQRRTAKVWAVVNVRAPVLVFWVEWEMHRRPFLGKRNRCRESTLLSGRAQ